MSGKWLVTCNPERWDIFGFLADGNTVADIQSWSVVRHIDELKDGDDIAFWITGSNRGVYAVGNVVGDASLDSGGAYWVDEADERRQRQFVPVRFDVDLMSHPILGAELSEDPRFMDATVVTVPWGGNPHRLTAEQWSAISDRLP